MAEQNVEFKIATDLANTEKKLAKAFKAIEELNRELSNLKNIEIEVNVIESKPKWWQFWKS